MILHSPDKKRRDICVGHRLHVRSRRQERFRHLHVTPRRRSMQGRTISFVLRLRVHPRLQDRSAAESMAVLDSHLLEALRGIVTQDFRHRCMLLAHGPLQCRVAILILRLLVRPRRQQHLHHRCVSLSRSRKQRRAVTLLISRLHVSTGRQKNLHHRGVTHRASDLQRRAFHRWRTPAGLLIRPRRQQFQHHRRMILHSPDKKRRDICVGHRLHVRSRRQERLRQRRVTHRRRGMQGRKITFVLRLRVRPRLQEHCDAESMAVLDSLVQRRAYTLERGSEKRAR